MQAAIFAVLLTGASAFVLSLRRASAVDFGFDVSIADGGAHSASGRDAERRHARELMHRAYERVASLPGVESASLGYMEPWLNNTEVPITFPGRR